MISLTTSPNFPACGEHMSMTCDTWGSDNGKTAGGLNGIYWFYVR